MRTGSRTGRATSHHHNRDRDHHTLRMAESESDSSSSAARRGCFSTEHRDAHRLVWNMIDLLHASHPQPLVRHHIDSMDDFLTTQLPKLFSQYNPIMVYSGFNEEANKYDTEVRLYFSNVRYSKPIIHENNGSTKPMYPVDARLRNLQLEVFGLELDRAVFLEGARLDDPASCGSYRLPILSHRKHRLIRCDRESFLEHLQCDPARHSAFVNVRDDNRQLVKWIPALEHGE